MPLIGIAVLLLNFAIHSGRCQQNEEFCENPDFQPILAYIEESENLLLQISKLISLLEPEEGDKIIDHPIKCNSSSDCGKMYPKIENVSCYQGTCNIEGRCDNSTSGCPPCENGEPLCTNNRCGCKCVPEKCPLCPDNSGPSSCFNTNHCDCEKRECTTKKHCSPDCKNSAFGGYKWRTSCFKSDPYVPLMVGSLLRLEMLNRFFYLIRRMKLVHATA